ncbi:MAG TPA: hypothetical protein VHF89_16660 [Solirubrobacteraceae bacterium]|nr:hypothetical protein [Solirubrobacteraceae bacterium]
MFEKIPLSAAAAVALLLTAAAPAAADVPEPAAAYELYETLEPGTGSGDLTEIEPSGQNTWEQATTPSITRIVMRLPAGNGVDADPAAPAGPDPTWSAYLHLSLDDVTSTRVFGPPDDAATGLFVVDGKLVFRRSGAADVVDDEVTMVAGELARITLTRDATGAVTIYLFGQPKLTFTDTSGAAAYPAAALRVLAGASGGRLARIRLWDLALAADDVAVLVPPELSVGQPRDGSRQSLRPTFSGGYIDDQGSPPTLQVVVHDDTTGDEVRTLTNAAAGGGSWSIPWQNRSPLQHDGRYRAHVSARDAHGNRSTIKRRFLADGAPPALSLTSEPPTETTDPTPYVAGTVHAEPGNLGAVKLTAYRRTEISYARAGETSLPIVDGRFAGELPTPLEPGEYDLWIELGDEAGNVTRFPLPLRVLPPTELKPPPPEVLAPPPIADPEPPALTTVRSLAAAARRLSRRTLLRRGRARMTYTAATEGTASVVLRARGRVIGRGRDTASGAGRNTLTVRVSRAGRRRLRRARLVTVRVVFAPASGAPAALTVRR